MLKVAGYVQPAASGVWRISDRGKVLLEKFPDRFDEETTRRIAREARSATRTEGSDGAAVETAPASQETPEERIDAAVREVQNAVARELLERISQAPPIFFESLVGVSHREVKVPRVDGDYFDDL